MVQKISLSELDVELRKVADKFKTENVPENSEKSIMSEDKEQIDSSVEDAKATEEPKLEAKAEAEETPKEEPKAEEMAEVKETLSVSVLEKIESRLANIEGFMASVETRNAALNELVSDLKAKLDEAPAVAEPKEEPKAPVEEVKEDAPEESKDEAEEEPKAEAEVEEKAEVEAPVEEAEPAVEEPLSKEDELEQKFAQLSAQIKKLRDTPVIRNVKTGDIKIAEQLSQEDKFNRLLVNMKKRR